MVLSRSVEKALVLGILGQGFCAFENRIVPRSRRQKWYPGQGSRTQLDFEGLWMSTLAAGLLWFGYLWATVVLGLSVEIDVSLPPALRSLHKLDDGEEELKLTSALAKEPGQHRHFIMAANRVAIGKNSQPSLLNEENREFEYDQSQCG